MGSGPNSFSVEMVGDNSGIGGMGVLPEQFWRRRRRGWREKAQGWNGGSREEEPHLVPSIKFETTLTQSLRMTRVSGLQSPESPALLNQNCKIKFVDMCVCKKSMFMRWEMA
jgi:hypothetical protein